MTVAAFMIASLALTVAASLYTDSGAGRRFPDPPAPVRAIDGPTFPGGLDAWRAYWEAV